MSRTISRAYVTAAWNKNRVDAEDQARKYCRELIAKGKLPICPVLMFSDVFDEEDPETEKKRRKMCDFLIKTCRELIICGEPDERVNEEASTAREAGVCVNMLSGVL